MPLVDFCCKDCNTTTEVLHRPHIDGDSPTPPKCPSCGKEMVKAIGQCSFVLKGTGWARDNYSNTGK